MRIKLRKILQIYRNTIDMFRSIIELYKATKYDINVCRDAICM